MGRESRACDKARDSRPKLIPTLKFPVADKLRNSQPKLWPTPKVPVADRAQDQPKLSPTPKFLWLTKLTIAEHVSMGIGQTTGV